MTNCFCDHLTRVSVLCLFPLLFRNSGNKHKNNPLVGADTDRHSSTYIILHILQHHDHKGDQTALISIVHFVNSVSVDK